MSMTMTVMLSWPPAVNATSARCRATVDRGRVGGQFGDVRSERGCI
jgi:hypothetical protein